MVKTKNQKNFLSTPSPSPLFRQIKTAWRLVTLRYTCTAGQHYLDDFFSHERELQKIDSLLSIPRLQQHEHVLARSSALDNLSLVIT